MPKVAQMGNYRGRIKPQTFSLTQCLFILTVPYYFFVPCVIEYYNSTHFPANHYFLETCSENRGCLALSTERVEFIISYCIWGFMVAINLMDVLLHQKQ